MRKPWHPLGRSALGGENENKYPPYNIHLCLPPERLSVTRVSSTDIWSATRNLTREADRNRCEVPNDILFLSGYKNSVICRRNQIKFSKIKFHENEFSQSRYAICATVGGKTDTVK